MNFEDTLAQYPERCCAVGAGVVAYRETGSGWPVVLLHGISSGAASWVQQLGGLGPDLRVIAWDAPGYGASTPLAQEAPLASDYAEALAGLVDELALGPFTLVGHSLGALTAAAYAAAAPRQVNRLVLLSPARGYALADAAEREQKYANRLAMLDRLGPDGLARERASTLLSPAASKEAVEWVAWNMRRLHPAGYRQAASMLAHDYIGRYAPSYVGPVAVISGDADHIAPVARCNSVADEFSNATYESIPGIGHALYLENPDLINMLLQRYAISLRQPVQAMT